MAAALETKSRETFRAPFVWVTLKPLPVSPGSTTPARVEPWTSCGTGQAGADGTYVLT
jgi:hypothetical protein